jgi:predicted Zn-dependent peptidase
MRAMRRVVALCLLSAVVGCADEGPPTLVLATQPRCEGERKECEASGATRFLVDGVPVLHQRVSGHPLVALRITFDRSPAQGGEQFWAETIALDVLGAAGPRRLGHGEWGERLADLSSEVSVGTGPDYLSFSIAAPRPRWRTVWSLMSEAVNDPSLEDYLLQHSQRANAASFQSELDRAGNAAAVESFSRALRGNYLNARREHLSALARLRMADLYEAWRSLRTKQRMMVTVVGDVADADVRAAVREAFGDLDEDHHADFGDPSGMLGDTASVAVLDYPDVPTWHVHSSFVGPTADAADYVPLWLGLSVLRDRLFDQIRDAEGLAYTVGAELNFYRQSYGNIWISTPQPARALAITRTNVRQLKDEGPLDEELARARAAYRKQLLDERATPTAMASSLADWQLTAGHFSTEGIVESLDAITAQEVAEALNVWLRDVSTVAAGSGEPLTEADLTALYE